MTRSRLRESGAASVLVLVLAASLTLVAAVGAAGSGLLVSYRRAAAAADLAALAAAGAQQRHDPVCPAARRTSGRNDARLVSCVVLGDVVEVEVRRDTRTLLGFTAPVTARARAGPVSPGDEAAR